MNDHDNDHEHSYSNCEDLLRSLSDYIDDDASQELCAQIEQHMRGCRRCTAVVNTLRKTVELYRGSALESSLPLDARRRLYARLNLEEYLK